MWKDTLKKIGEYCFMYYVGGFFAWLILMGKVTGLGSTFEWVLFYFIPLLIAVVTLLIEKTKHMREER